MTKPDIMVTVEPTVSGKLTYLPLGAPSADSESMVKIVLRLRITNNYTDRNVVVKAIRFDFPSTSVDMKNVNAYNNMNIEPGKTATWSNGIVDLNPDPDIFDSYNNSVFLLAPGPSNITIKLTCQGYNEDFTITEDLVPHKSPTPTGSYLFPYATSDLGVNEFFITSGVHWANGGSGGSQIFAHDIGVVGLDPQSQQWSETDNSSNLNNEDYRIWEMPVRAVADGEVVGSRDTMVDNPIKIVNGQLQFPDKPPGAGNDWVYGNYILIRTNNAELVRYCHLQKDSIPGSLTQNGTQVNAGCIVGKVGNSGHTTNPHTHIECSSTSGALRPFPFHNAWIVSYDKLKAGSTKGLWVSLDAQGIAKERCVVFPSFNAPYLNSPLIIPSGQAVDPLYLVLPGEVYSRIIEWLHPHEPKVAEIRQIFRSMSRQERRVALNRAKTLVEYGNAVVKAAEEEFDQM